MAFVPTVGRRETALPCPHHLGTAGIDLNPLAGKRGDGECLCPYNGDQGRETALPYPHHLGTAGIDLNPLAGKSELRPKTKLVALLSEEVSIPLRGKVNCDVTRTRIT